ncbi:MAG: glucokinase [Candidatus Scalindua sp.]|nr:ROK family protein [Planctomycetota bacterium]GJQ59405.1 MAG: glucokinase [Candidatus Scalindua sp.]
MEHNTYVMAADVGGTNTRIAVVSSQGEIHTLIKRDTHCKGGKDEMLSFLISLFKETIKKSQLPREKISGLGIGFPGPLDAQTGVIFNPPNLPGWNNIPLRNILENEFGSPVVIENDANAAALGEWWKGVGVGTKSFVCITLGTGVGGGIILGGKLWHGASSMAGEIGHTTIVPNGIPCTCGNRGCLEAYASARGITDRTRRILSETEKNREAETPLTFKDISHMVSQGDDRILPIIQETGVILGIAVANLANLLNPEMIALFGGVTSLGERLLSPMKEEVEKRAFQKAREPLRIEVAKLGDNGGLLGAAKSILVHLDA